MFNPKYWIHCAGITVKEFCNYLQKCIPPEAVMCVCGDAQIYMHLEEDESVFSVNDCSLSDLPEYGNCEVREFLIGGRTA